MLKLRTPILLLLLWTAIGLAFASQFYLSSTLSGRSIAWSEALSQSLADWYVWAVLSLVPLFLAKRHPIERRERTPSLLIHISASLLVALAYAFIRALVAQGQILALGELIPFIEIARPLLFKTFYFNVVIYWIIVAVTQAFDYYRKYHDREKATLELEKRLSEARLQALQMQLNPHFLFNAMHSISTLMHRDVEAADSMLARLSELLRLTLKSDNAQTIPLSQELQILERYLDIERIRFGDRLAIELDIDPETLAFHVPSLILQPVVENSLRHGIAPFSIQGVLKISSLCTDDDLVLTVTDNGGGIEKPITEGVGISNVRNRLQELYGGMHTFSISNNQPPPGVTVTLRFPATTDALASANTL